MKAVGYRQPLAIDAADALIDVELPDPVASGRDLLVQVRAVSVNPVDTKIRRSAKPAADTVKVLGWDAAGVVVSCGPDASLFRPGDEVWYAGSVARQGTNAQLHLVDERIVGRKPKSLDFAHSAAMPLTTITAWELLFDRLGFVPGKRPTNETLLIVGAAGGVGSILVQLARRLTAATVIGTASRPETSEWVRELGAHHVLDHSKPLAAELKRIGLENVSHVASLTHTDEHFAQIVEALAPQGKLGLIDDPAKIDVRALRAKCLSLHWEAMFVRSLYKTPDMIAQHRLLDEVSALVDSGVIRSTIGEHFGRIDATNLKRAHAMLETGTARGKIVLEGF